MQKLNNITFVCRGNFSENLLIGKLCNEEKKKMSVSTRDKTNLRDEYRLRDSIFYGDGTCINNYLKKRKTTESSRVA